MKPGRSFAALAIFALAASALHTDDLVVESVFIRLSEDVNVAARAAGTLASMNVREGQAVKVGDTLGQIDDAEQKLEAESARLDLLMARTRAENRDNLEFSQKEVGFAEVQLARAEASRENLKTSISLKEIEDVKLALERAAVEVKRSKFDLAIADLTQKLKAADVARAEQQIERRKILAPLRGIVSKIDRQPGEWVQPGERVLRIVRLDMLRAEGFVDARAAIAGIEGAAVTVSVATPSGTPLLFKGHLVFIDPEVEPTTSQVRIRAEIDNEKLRLRPGMSASMVVHLPLPATTNAAAPEQSKPKPDSP